MSGEQNGWAAVLAGRVTGCGDDMSVGGPGLVIEVSRNQLHNFPHNLYLAEVEIRLRVKPEGTVTP